MTSGLRFRTWLCGILTVVAIYLLIPTVWSLWHPDDNTLPKGTIDTAMRLGLDLKGGVHMVLGVDLDKVVVDQLAAHGRSLEKGAKSENIEIEKVTLDEKKVQLEIKSVNDAGRKKFEEYVNKHYSDTLELLSPIGDTDVVRMVPRWEEQVRDRARDQSIETIRNRIDEFGVSEPLISKKGDDQILVQFPGAKEPDRLKNLIGQTAQLNFQIVSGCDQDKGDCIPAQRKDLQTKIEAAEKSGAYTRESFPHFSDYRSRINADLKAQIPAETTIAFEKSNDPNEISKIKYIPILLSTKEVFSGEYIDEASVGMGGGRGMGASRPEVNFHINPSAAKNFETFTGEHVGHYMAIVLDGVVKSFPVLQSAIGDSGRVTLGGGSIDDVMKEAKDLSIVLRAGALPATIEVQEERVIGPSIGADAIEAGKLGLLYSLALVFAFVSLYYGLAGVVASFVTAINIAMIFAILGSLHATLTLPGIAGIVLTIAMAIDAMIIIFERMREETRLGRNSNQVIELGFSHAFSAILDSNLTTFIGAAVLLEFGTGSIKGFAFTLIVGLVTNIFMATYYCKTVFLLMNHGRFVNIGMTKKHLAEIEAH